MLPVWTGKTKGNIYRESLVKTDNEDGSSPPTSLERVTPGTPTASHSRPGSGRWWTCVYRWSLVLIQCEKTFHLYMFEPRLLVLMIGEESNSNLQSTTVCCSAIRTSTTRVWWLVECGAGGKADRAVCTGPRKDSTQRGWWAHDDMCMFMWTSLAGGVIALLEVWNAPLSDIRCHRVRNPL